MALLDLELEIDMSTSWIWSGYLLYTLYGRSRAEGIGLRIMHIAHELIELSAPGMSGVPTNLLADLQC